MPEQNINNEYPEMPSNDMNEDSGGKGLVGQSQLKDIMDSAAGIDPTRFWIVLMVFLIIGLASTLVFGGRYLVDQGKNKDVEIANLRQEIKDCPQKTLDDFQKQQQRINELKEEGEYNKQLFKELREDKLKDREDLKKMNNKLEKLAP